MGLKIPSTSGASSFIRPIPTSCTSPPSVISGTEQGTRTVQVDRRRHDMAAVAADQRGHGRHGRGHGRRRSQHPLRRGVSAPAARVWASTAADPAARSLQINRRGRALDEADPRSADRRLRTDRHLRLPQGSAHRVRPLSSKGCATTRPRRTNSARPASIARTTRARRGRS